MDTFPIPTLVTERLRLRPFRGSDLDDYAALKADPEVQRHLGSGGPWDRDRSWRHQAFLMGHWSRGLRHGGAGEEGYGRREMLCFGIDGESYARWRDRELERLSLSQSAA